MPVTLLTHSAYRWLSVDFVNAEGQGRVVPRLVVRLKAEKLRSETRVRVSHLFARLKLDEELLSPVQVLVPEREVRAHDQWSVEFPLSAAALEAVAQRVGSGRVNLTLTLSGAITVFMDPTYQRKYESDPEPGTWSEVEITPTDLVLPIADSDWYLKVLTPLGTYRYVLWTVAIPKAQDAGPLALAVGHIVDAEQALALGDDPAVFGHCRGAWDALPGAKQNIFDALVADLEKRATLDELGKVAGQFLHRGRHVATSGPQAGDFAVDHRDAELALNMTKLLVGYVSRLA